MYFDVDTSTNYTMTVNFCTNTGNVTGDEYVSGVFGYVYLNNRYRNVAMVATHVNNSGKIEGTSKVAALFGYFYSDTASTITQYGSTGTVFTAGVDTSTVLFNESTNLTLQ